MSQIKKIVISLLIGIIAILGLATTVNAYSLGDAVFIDKPRYEKSNNLFCVEHTQRLWTVGRYYIVKKHIRIEGRKSYNITKAGNKTEEIDAHQNAVFAAILSEIGGKTYKKDQIKKAIWYYGDTWTKKVGINYGLKDFASSKDEGEQTLNKKAQEYATSLSQNTKVEDKTDKSKIKVTSYQKDGKDYLRVGPFNWTFNGKLTKISVKNQDGKNISGVTYSKTQGKTQKEITVGSIKSGSNFYLSIPASANVTEITKIEAEGSVDVKGADIWFLQAPEKRWQNLISAEPINAKEPISSSFKYSIPLLGDLKIIKVDQDNHERKLDGVGFIIQDKTTGKYVKKDSKGNITYVSKENATEFITNKNGEITIKNLPVGTYVAQETKNPHYGYRLNGETVEMKVVSGSTSKNTFTIENDQEYVKLSGFVWVDKIFGKQSVRNDLFKDNDFDSDDILLDGITVRLMDKTTGKAVKETKTSELGKYKNSGNNGHGEYLFEDVLTEKLGDYYIEFEYNGLTCTNVVPHIDKDNGSKAAENANVRNEFNQNFAVVEGKTENTSITRDNGGNEKHTLTYNLDQNEHTATLINDGQYEITANTNETGYNIKSHYQSGVEEIKYINLGLYAREQPDIALVKDLENVKISVNGYHHVYQYAQRFVNQGEYINDYLDKYIANGGKYYNIDNNGNYVEAANGKYIKDENGEYVEKDKVTAFNVGVKFGEKYGTMSYSRAIYQADYEYQTDDKSKELKVYATYKISMKNESSNLVAQVNSIVDYYDSKYSIVKVGTEIDQEGNVTGDIGHQEATYNDKYAKTIISTNRKIEAQKQADIYVQFELNRDAVLNILNAKENLDNVAEINSYSIFDKDGNIYAGVDKDSNPGNVVPGNKATYQDDTDSAPGLQLEVADAREMAGKVFLDDSSKSGGTGKIRVGSGAYEEGEKGIQGVEVTLTENIENGKVYKATTDENGDFLITGFIPGDYTLTYTWGDQTYTVQNYKGTIYDSTRDKNNKNWYKENVDQRLTDAMDNLGTRQKIDEEMKDINKDSQTTIQKMDSTTPTMGIGVEYETTYTASAGDKYTYRIHNVDFGIVERAKQDISLEKNIKTFKLTLANGQVMADVTIETDEKGNKKLTGEKNYVTYMAPSQNANPKNGFVKLELDNELIQGSTVEVGYEIKAINKSEVDYMTDDYYLYGTEGGQKVTITPSAIVDYLDKDWGFEAEKNKEWQVKTQEDITGLVIDNVYNNEESAIGNKTILYTEALKTPLEPEGSKSVMLNVSKILSTADEISLDNETEIVKVEKTGGSKLTTTPGNYVPGTGHTEGDDSMAETVIITPSTGANLAFIIPVMIGVIALVILATGVVIIKKKALGEK